jgi:hypothetical protein
MKGRHSEIYSGAQLQGQGYLEPQRTSLSTWTIVYALGQGRRGSEQSVTGVLFFQTLHSASVGGVKLAMQFVDLKGLSPSGHSMHD